MSVTSTGAPARSMAADSPPKPTPTITTRWRAGASVEVSGAELKGVSVGSSPTFRSDDRAGQDASRCVSRRSAIAPAARSDHVPVQKPTGMGRNDMATPTSGLQLRSMIKASGELELSPGRRAASPRRPPTRCWSASRPRRSIPPTSACCWARPTCRPPRRPAGRGPMVTASVPPQLMRAMAGRVDQSMPVGNEGAGVVVAAGLRPGGPGAARQDRRHARRRHVRPVPHR